MRKPGWKDLEGRENTWFAWETFAHLHPRLGEQISTADVVEPWNPASGTSLEIPGLIWRWNSSIGWKCAVDALQKFLPAEKKTVKMQLKHLTYKVQSWNYMCTIILLTETVRKGSCYSRNSLGYSCYASKLQARITTYNNQTNQIKFRRSLSFIKPVRPRPMFSSREIQPMASATHSMTKPMPVESEEPKCASRGSKHGRGYHTQPWFHNMCSLISVMILIQLYTILRQFTI